MPSLTPHAGKDSQRADLRLPGITRLTPHPVRATGEDKGNRFGSQRWGDPEATRINVEPAKDCKSLPAQPSVVVWPPSGSEKIHPKYCAKDLCKFLILEAFSAMFQASRA